MKISQLIKELEKIKAEHGDVLATLREWRYDGHWAGIEGLDVHEGRCWDYADPDTCYTQRTHVRIY